MPIYIGNDKIESIYVGSDKVKSIYVGADEVYRYDPFTLNRTRVTSGNIYSNSSDENLLEFIVNRIGSTTAISPAALEIVNITKYTVTLRGTASSRGIGIPITVRAGRSYTLQIEWNAPYGYGYGGMLAFGGTSALGKVIPTEDESVKSVDVSINPTADGVYMLMLGNTGASGVNEITYTIKLR